MSRRVAIGGGITTPHGPVLVLPTRWDLVDALAALFGSTEDLELTADDEETVDDEPSLGSLNNSHSDQRDWGTGGTMDLEPAGDDEARVQLAHVTADTFLQSNDEMRGVINSGHTRDLAFVIRTVGDDHEPRRFRTP
jgi:hypothetical protein